MILAGASTAGATATLLPAWHRLEGENQREYQTSLNV